MKILLTGRPGIGKSTILCKVTKNLTIPKFGVIAHEILDEQNERIGFQSTNFNGDSSIFAHKTAFTSSYKVADFFVNLDSIDQFVVNEIKKGLSDKSGVLIIDEIGRMQSYSSKFMNTLEQSFDNPETNILSTIVLEPEPWSLPFKQHPQTIVIEVDRDHQSLIINFLTNLYNDLSYFKSLTPIKKQKVIDLANHYAQAKKYIQLDKLFTHAIKYTAQNRLQLIKENTYQIQGDHNTHTIQNNQCTCDLFTGKNQYKNTPGDCSHLQTLILTQIS